MNTMIKINQEDNIDHSEMGCSNFNFISVNTLTLKKWQSK
jgi:hypothetical protein